MVGIYCIKNIITNQVYIGQSVEIENRWKRHLQELEAKTHHNIFLQRSWNKYGKNSFEFSILELCDNNRNLLNERETYWWSKYKDNAFNLGRTGNACNMSDETKKKISNALKGSIPYMKGKHHTEEAKRKQSMSRKGKGHPQKEEAKEKIRLANLGRTFSEETLLKMKLAQRNRKPISEETRIKMRIANAGTKNGFYGKKHRKETKEQLRQLHLGTHLSIDTRNKMSASRLGKKHKKKHNPIFSEEAKRKMLHLKKVNQYDLDHNFIKQWNSIKEASINLDINESSITRVCKKHRNKAGIFYWEYAS